jgi:uncharacterized protein YbaA (DUF1428 family)
MLPEEVTTTSNSSFNVKDGAKGQPEAPRRRGVSRRHSVGFQPVTHAEVREFDMHAEEFREIFWYSRDEYDIIKARNSLIVKMMKTGHFKESEEHTFRGLEHKLKEGFKKRRAHKFNGLNAVLEEQDRQYARGVTKPEAIAEEYRRISSSAAETAGVVGTRDFQNSYCFAIDKQEGNISDMTSEMTKSSDEEADSNADQRRDMMADDDTIATEDSSASRTRLKIRGLFSAVSMSKTMDGKMNRRSSM